MKVGKYDYLKPLCRARTPKKVRRLCKKMSDEQLQRMVDLTLDIMRKKIPVKPQGVSIILANRKALRHFVNPSYSLKSKRRFLIQKGGSIGSALGNILRATGSVLGRGLSTGLRAVGRPLMSGLAGVGRAVGKTPLGKTVVGKMAQGYRRFGAKPSWGSVGRPAWRYLVKPAAKYAFRKGVREPFQRKFVQPMRRNWNALRMRAEESGRAVKYRVQGLTKSGRERVRLDRQKFEDSAMDEFVDLKRSGLTQHKPQGAIDRLKFRRNYETLQRAEKRAEAHLKNPDSFDNDWWLTKKIKGIFKGKRSVSAPAAPIQRRIPGVESNLQRGQTLGDLMDFAHSQAAGTRQNKPSRVNLPQSWGFLEKFNKWRGVPTQVTGQKLGSVKAPSHVSSKTGSFHTAIGDEYKPLINLQRKPPSVKPESVSGGKRQLRWPKKPSRSARQTTDDESQYWNPPKHAGPWGPQIKIPGGGPKKVPLDTTRMTRSIARKGSTPEYAQLKPRTRRSTKDTYSTIGSEKDRDTLSTRVDYDMPGTSTPRVGEIVPPPIPPRAFQLGDIIPPPKPPRLFLPFRRPSTPSLASTTYADLPVPVTPSIRSSVLDKMLANNLSKSHPLHPLNRSQRLVPYDLSDVSTLSSKSSLVSRRSNDPLPPIPKQRRTSTYSLSSVDDGYYPADLGALNVSGLPSGYRSNVSNVQRFVEQNYTPVRRRANSLGPNMNPRTGVVHASTQYEMPQLTFGQKLKRYARDTGLGIVKAIPATVVTGAIGAGTTYGVMEALGYNKGSATQQQASQLPPEYSRPTKPVRKVSFADQPWSEPYAGERTNKRAKYDDIPYLKEHNPAATTTHWWD